MAPILRGMSRDFEIVFDIGANTGYVSLEMLYYFPKAIVYSFEPCSETYNNLLKNIDNAGYEKRSKPYRLGFFDIETDKILNITSFHGANSIIDISDEYHRMNPHIENVKTEVIPLIKIDDFVMQNKIEHIDLVKIDVEGVEYQILKGGKETFTKKVDTVIMEISFVRHPYLSGEFIKIFQLMHDYGFAPR
jgi:FkbM family methyltransferase